MNVRVHRMQRARDIISKAHHILQTDSVKTNTSVEQLSRHGSIQIKKHTLENIVQFGHSRLYTQVNRLLAKVNNNTTKNTRIDLKTPRQFKSMKRAYFLKIYFVFNLQHLGNLSSLRLLKCTLKSSKRSLVQRRSRSDRHRQLSLILS